MNKVVALCLLCLPLGCASADDAFDGASHSAYAILEVVALSPVCQPAEVAPSQRKQLSDALAFVTIAGLSHPAGLTPLDFSVIADDVSSIDRFIALGYSPVTRDIHGGTLLHGAALTGSKHALLHLLVMGADPNSVDRAGSTPLMVAAAGNRPEIALALLSAGASVSPRTRDGATALHYALVCRNQTLIQALLAAGAEVDARARQIAVRFDVALPEDDPEQVPARGEVK